MIYTLILVYFYFCILQGSESSVEAMEEKDSSGDTLINKIISILRVIAGPLVKNTVRVYECQFFYFPCILGLTLLHNYYFLLSFRGFY